MNTKTNTILVTLFAIVVAALAAVTSTIAAAMELDQFEVSWYRIAGGGGTSGGGAFNLTGTIGQHEAGTMSGGGFTLAGGFWAGSALDVEPVLCPGDLSGPEDAPDGTVDVFDLIALINFWGPCTDPGNCPADLSGPVGEPDGTVDVFDLIELINNWGPCP